MKDFFTKKVISGGTALLLSLVVCAASVGITTQVVRGSDTPPSDIAAASSVDSQTLYQQAMADAMVIEEEEILPLVALTENSPLCSWNEEGQVLLLTHHARPERYQAGSDYTLADGEIWTFTDKELLQWYEQNKDSVSDWPLRFKQLIGLPEEKQYTHFSAFWVDPADVIRPGYVQDIASSQGAAAFPTEPDDAYKEWFNDNLIWSYYESAYPWTRLGYTYDWAADSGEYGLSEFIILDSAETQVEFTMTTEEFLAWMDEQ